MTSAALHQPSRREILSDLLARLRRVEAASDSLKSLTSMHGTPTAMLTEALNSLERDLTLALRDAEQARTRISG